MLSSLHPKLIYWTKPLRLSKQDPFWALKSPKSHFSCRQPSLQSNESGCVTVSAAHPSCQGLYGIDTRRRRRNSDRSGAGARTAIFHEPIHKAICHCVCRLRPEDAADTCPSARNGLTLAVSLLFIIAPTRVELFVWFDSPGVCTASVRSARKPATTP